MCKTTTDFLRTVAINDKIINVAIMRQVCIVLKGDHFSYIDRVLHMYKTFKMTQNILKWNRHSLILVFDFNSAEMNEFILVVCGECHFSYAQSMCKVLNLSAVCGVRAIGTNLTLEVNWVLVDLWIMYHRIMYPLQLLIQWVEASLQ